MTTGTRQIDLRKRNRFKFNWKRDLPLWGLILPAMIYVLLFRYKSFLGIQIAFKNYRITKDMWDCAWVGMKNFNKLFGNPMFTTVLQNTVIISLLKIAIGFPAPIIVALMLNEVRSSGQRAASSAGNSWRCRLSGMTARRSTTTSRCI